MKDCILIGRPNVGKTTFFLNFAAFLGVKNCSMLVKGVDGKVHRRNYSIDMAKRYLISATPFKTKEIWKLELNVPVYKGSLQILLTDSSGLIDGISKDEVIRKSMAQTLQQLQQAKMILHIVDASAVRENEVSTLSEIDRQINEYGKLRGGYCMIANKMDKGNALEGLAYIKNEFSDTYIVPVSSIHHDGFKEVRMFVARNL